MVPRPKAKNGTRRSTFREICAHDYENAFLAPWEALFSDPAPIIARSYQAITPSAQIGISRFQIRRLSEFHTKPSDFGEDFGFFGPKWIPRARRALQTRLWLENRDWTGVDRRFISFLSQRTGTGLVRQQDNQANPSILLPSSLEPSPWPSVEPGGFG